MMFTGTALGLPLSPVVISELVVPEPSEVLLSTSLVDLQHRIRKSANKIVHLHNHSAPQQQQDKKLTCLTSAGVNLNVMARK